MATKRKLIRRTAAEAATARAQFSAGRFRDFAQLASDWWWEQDANFRFTLISRLDPTGIDIPLEEVLGKTREELYGERGRLLYPANWAEHDKIMAAHQAFQDFLIEWTRADGTKAYIALRGKPLFNAAGEFEGYRGVGNSIPERYLAEQSLRESEVRFRELVENSIQGIVIHLDRKPVFANQAFADSLGYSVPEVLELPSVDYWFPLSERERMERYAQRRLAGQKAPTRYQVQALRKDGWDVTWIVAARRILWNGKAAVQATLIDDTKHVQAEKQLRRALRAKARESRKLSSLLLDAQEAERGRIARELHDGISTSLASINIDIREAKRRRTRAQTAQALDSIIDRLGDKVAELHDIAMGLRPAFLDERGVWNALRWEVGQFKQRHRTMTVFDQLAGSDADIPETLTVPIYRIAQEALANVGKHSGARTVWVALEITPQTLRLCIEDDGHGMPARVDKTTLGIKSIRQRADLSGGQCVIKPRQGGGTSVAIVWPRQCSDSSKRCSRV